jgi:hypothetical protein
VLPWELDEVDLRELRGALYEAYVYRVFAQYGRDMGMLSEEEVELAAWVEELRERG